MKDITVTELQEDFEAILEEVSDGESFTINGNDDGLPIAVLIPVEEYESLTNVK